MQLPTGVATPQSGGRHFAGWTRPGTVGTVSIDFTWPVSRSTVTRTGNFPGPRSKVSSRTIPAGSVLAGEPAAGLLDPGGRRRSRSPAAPPGRSPRWRSSPARAAAPAPAAGCSVRRLRSRHTRAAPTHPRTRVSSGAELWPVHRAEVKHAVVPGDARVWRQRSSPSEPETRASVAVWPADRPRMSLRRTRVGVGTSVCLDLRTGFVNRRHDPWQDRACWSWTTTSSCCRS